MTTTTTDTDVARWVAGFGRWVFDQLDDLGRLVEAPLSRPSPRRADLDIEARCHALLTDPQTSGGLLVSCAADKADAIAAMIVSEGYPHARVIGRVEAGSPSIRVS